MNLVQRYTLVIVGVVAATVLALSWVLVGRFQEAIHDVTQDTDTLLANELTQQLARRGEVLARFLADDLVDPIHTTDFQAVATTAISARSQPDVAYVYVLDADGLVLHDGTRELALYGRSLSDPVSHKAAAAPGVLVQRSADGIDVAAPIRLGDRRLGTVRVGLTLSGALADIAAMRDHLQASGDLSVAEMMRTHALVGVLMILCATVLAGFASRRLATPVAQIATYARQVGEGDFSGRLPLGRTDEIGRLAADLQEMARRRQAAEQDLERAIQDLRFARDRALEASRAKSSFMATMSHELRTPLNHVIGYAEMIREELEEKDPRLAQDAATVENSARDLLAMIQNVLDVALIESERVELQPREVDVARLLQGALQRCGGAAQAGGNQLQSALAPDLGTIVTDPARVDQILDHLLSNAAKFTKQGVVRMEAAREEHAVRVSIIDTGIGIAPAQLLRIFDPFTQADDTSTRIHGGAGLGLAICNGLIRALGGEIAVHSEEGKGSTFLVRLPISGPPPPPTSSA